MALSYLINWNQPRADWKWLHRAAVLRTDGNYWVGRVHCKNTEQFLFFFFFLPI